MNEMRDDEGLTIQDVFAIIRRAFDVTGVTVSDKHDARLLLRGYEAAAGTDEERLAQAAVRRWYFSRAALLVATEHDCHGTEDPCDGCDALSAAYVRELEARGAAQVLVEKAGWTDGG